MRYQYPDTVIQVFCKAPIAGQVKTRLITELITAEQAMQVHVELTERVLTLLHEAALCPVQLWCSPTLEDDFFRQWAASYSLTLHRQSACGLGGRMSDAMNAGLQVFKRVLLIGCDCPSLITDDFKQAINALKHGADVVLAPTEDGGYSLIGVNKPQTALLRDNDMPWGTAQVLAITRERIKQQQLKGHEIRLQWDIDTPEDLSRYRGLFF
ncbi:MAG: TIGR04282 family arsenosugar biosynthesis glycosyltransferase [Methylobacter sp.]|nr:TIGR04282 family arsenosugar biosynthesis glycosyltransferase [Methylobacter sp.]